MKKTITITKKATVNAIGERTNGNTKPVLCLDTGMVYTSCIDAAKENNCAQSEVSMVCTGKRETVKGLRFCYLEDLAQHMDEISVALQKHSASLAEERHARMLAEAEEKRQEAIATAREKVNRKQEKFDRLSDRMTRLYESCNEASRELEKAKAELKALMEEPIIFDDFTYQLPVPALA